MSGTSDSVETLESMYLIAHLNITGGPVTTAPGTPDMISIIMLIMDGARPGDFQYSPEGRAIVREWYKRERRPVPRDLKPTRRSIGSVIRDYLSRCVLCTIFFDVSNVDEC